MVSFEKIVIQENLVLQAIKKIKKTYWKTTLMFNLNIDFCYLIRTKSSRLG